jgi:hypothetical protein
MHSKFDEKWELHVISKDLNTKYLQMEKGN